MPGRRPFAFICPVPSGSIWRFPFRHRGTPSPHPFRTMGFSMKSTIQRFLGVAPFSELETILVFFQRRHGENPSHSDHSDGDFHGWTEPSKSYKILVGGFNPSEKYESQLGWWFPTYGKIKPVPNHQPEISSGDFDGGFQQVMGVAQARWMAFCERENPSFFNGWGLEVALWRNGNHHGWYNWMINLFSNGTLNWIG